ncbi:hypothetical protein GCM10023183_04000 [Nibribacter koreensis]|uniref:Transglutaminase-like domain-containing protein n=1 Tax=Nibribacter koreensis TaxID=1084519 RepID=A0ABP8F7W6_9BACT
MLAWCFAHESKAQSIDRIIYYDIDEYAAATPDSHRKSIISLTNYLVKPYASDHEKARSIYAWIVKNLSYDHALAKRKNIPSPSIKHILRTRKAICSGYSALFKAMCDIAGLECEIVIGYSREYNEKVKRRKSFTWSDHGWNAVKIDSVWYPLDATWERKEKRQKGTTIGYNYFLTDPKEFILDHLPAVPYWQLLSCPISLKEFKKPEEEIKVLLKKDTFCQSFNDSISADSKLSDAHRNYKMATDAFRFNDRNHLAMGLGYLNHGTYFLNLSNSYTFIEAKLSGTVLAHSYYASSLSHLRKSKKKKHLAKSKKYIASTKARIKKLEALQKKSNQKSNLAVTK